MKKLAVLGAMVLGLGAGTISAQETLPYISGFETHEGFEKGNLEGQGGWRVDRGQAVVADGGRNRGQTIVVEPSDPTGQISLHLERPESPVVFSDFWVKPAAGEPIEESQFVDVEGSITGFFKFDAKGYLYVLNGDGKGGGTWVAASDPILTDEGKSPDFVRITIRQDFESKTWDVAVNGKLELVDLGLWEADSEYLGRFSLMGHTALPLVFDDLTIDAKNLLNAEDKDLDGVADSLGKRDSDADKDGLSTIEEVLAGTDPAQPDTDFDGLLDGDEAAAGRDPLIVDIFSSRPSDEDISKRRPLAMPVGRLKASSLRERQAVSAAVTPFASRREAAFYNVSELETFVRENPEGAYRPWVQAALCHEYFRAGKFTKALEGYRAFWQEFESAEPVSEELELGWKQLMEAVEIEFSDLAARFGEDGEAEALIDAMATRSESVGNAVRFLNVRAALRQARANPAQSYRCGEKAIRWMVENSGAVTPEVNDLLREAVPSGKGFSLAEVRSLAARSGKPLVAAQRQGAQEIPLPAIAHWKAGHYSILSERKEGGYLVEDPSFDKQYFVPDSTIEEEGSGYFLVDRLAPGFSEASEAALRGVRGGSLTKSLKNDDCPNGCEGESSSQKMASYTRNMYSAGYTIRDTPIWVESPLVGDLEFTVNWVYHGQARPRWVESSHFEDPKWFISWTSVVQEQWSSNDVEIWLPDGRKETYEWNGSGYDVNPKSASQLYRNSGGNQYALVTSSGAVLEYRKLITGSSEPDRLYLTAVVNPDSNTLNSSNLFNPSVPLAGRRITVEHNSYGVKEVKDELGNGFYFSYVSATSRLQYVTDNLSGSRKATMSYSGSGPRLSYILDPEGIKSQFGYDGTGTNITSMTTPYGTTTFTTGVSGDLSWCKITDPRGYTEKIALNLGTISGDLAGLSSTNVISSEIPSGAGWDTTDCEKGTSLYWDKKAMNDFGETHSQHYQKAAQVHWMRDSAGGQILPYATSTRTALTHRVFYKYPSGSTFPSHVARKVENSSGTSPYVDEVWQYEHNAMGNVTKVTDPSDRKVWFRYTNASNLYDLTKVEVEESTGVYKTVQEINYTSGTSRVSSIKDSAGKTTTFGYYTSGSGKNQLKTVTDPDGVTKFDLVPNTSSPTSYGDYGWLGRVQRKSNSSSYVTIHTNNSFDSLRRVTQSTDADGYSLQFVHDNLNRVTKVTYPGPGSSGSNYEEFVYSKTVGAVTTMYPELQQYRDREGKWTTYEYNGNRQLSKVIDPDNGTANPTEYEWCRCGDLEWIIDPREKKTTWHRDLLGRVDQKDLPGGKKYQYVYFPGSGALKGMNYPADFDASPPVTATTAKYYYYADGNVKKIDYGASNTPDVEFTYDTYYDRLLTMKDGATAAVSSSAKWQFSYYNLQSTGGGKLAQVDGPWTSDIVQYDYDDLGRVTKTTHALLSSFQHIVDPTFDYLGRITSVGTGLGTFTLGHVSSTSPLVNHVTYPNGQHAYYDYLSHSSGRFLNKIRNWKTTSGTKISEHTYGSYSNSGQIGTWKRDASLPSSSYNRTFTMSSSTAYDDLYRIKTVTDSSPTVNYTFGYDRSNNRITKNSVTYGVTDDNLLTNSAGAEYEFSYNGNGCMTEKIDDSTDDVEVKYEWDSINRLTVIEVPGVSKTEFSYDGFSRRYKMIEKTALVGGGWSAGTHSLLLWDGTDLVQKRTGGTFGQLTTDMTNYFRGSGEVRWGLFGNTNYFFTTDHLGSVREVTDSSKNVKAAYDYSPYGIRTQKYSSGGLDVQEGYTGHWYHKDSMVHLAMFRAYDTEIGRWLSPDPAGYIDGPNLYAYVQNQPFAYRDLDGRGKVSTVYNIGKEIVNKGWDDYKDLVGKLPNKRGKAPKCKNGKPLEIHHNNQKNRGPKKIMTREEHRGKGNHAKNHDLSKPSEVDHTEFNRERKKFWEGEWDTNGWGETLSGCAVAMIPTFLGGDLSAQEFLTGDITDAFNGAKSVGHTVGKALVDGYHTPVDANRIKQGVSVCFIEGTLVKTPTGEVRIEKIERGQKVRGYDERLDKVVEAIVENCHVSRVARIYLIKTENEDIYVTEEHPFYIVEKGYTPVKNLKKGDRLKTIDGVNVCVEKVSEVSKNCAVYNISVQNVENYYVGKQGILVHNK